MLCLDSDTSDSSLVVSYFISLKHQIRCNAMYIKSSAYLGTAEPEQILNSTAYLFHHPMGVVAKRCT